MVYMSLQCSNLIHQRLLVSPSTCKKVGRTINLLPQMQTWLGALLDRPAVSPLATFMMRAYASA
jgi:hypothetical protein